MADIGEGRDRPQRGRDSQAHCREDWIRGERTRNEPRGLHAGAEQEARAAHPAAEFRRRRQARPSGSACGG